MKWLKKLSTAEMLVLKLGSLTCVIIFVVRAILHELGR